MGDPLYAYGLARALYAFGVGAAVAVLLAAWSLLMKAFPEEGDDEDESHFDND